MSNKSVIRIILDQRFIEAAALSRSRSSLTVRKYERFILPAALESENAAQKPADIAGFIADSLKQEGFEEDKIELFFGNEIGFYSKYSIHSDHKRLIAERRKLHIEQTLGDEAKQYIIEERRKETEEEDGFRTYTIYGIKRDYLGTLIKALKTRGYKVVFAGSSHAPIEEARTHPAATYDFRYGGIGKRQTGRIMNILLTGALALLILLAAMLPVQQASLAKRVQTEQVTLASDAYKTQHEKLEKLRDLKTEEKRFEESAAFLSASETGFGILLQDTLGRELLKGARIIEAVYDEQTDLILDVIIPDAAAFEQIRSRINDERNVSVTEAAPPEAIVKDGEPGKTKWRVQIHVASFDAKGDKDASETASGDAGGNGDPE
jgi:hypothetical protein